MQKTGRILTVLCACGARRWGSAFLTSTTRISRTTTAARTHSRWTAVQPHMAMSVPISGVNINKDVVVIGGGLAGLSTALELAKRGRQVTVLSRSRAEAAAEAAGGMIAPQAERLESGPYLDLCLQSRSMYADWVSSIEAIAGLGGEKAETHFWSCGGFVSPAFEGDAVHVWSPPVEGGQAHWIDRDQALEMEPSLSGDIVGAWWFPQDMSIDAQRMFTVLEQACGKAGVEILQGTAAASLLYSPEGSSVDAVVLADGRQLHANAVVSAAGAWMRELMPVPMVPHKGQMMSLRQPEGGRGEGSQKQGGGLGLTRVFFAEGCYIIPKRDGRIVVGSTVEVGEYGLHITPAGMKQIIDAAVKVCPALADLAVERTWAGLRPVTPDTFPVLGASPRCPNLFVAGGYWRNGVLLAPKTAQLVADAVCGCLSPEDDVFSQAFSMDRFSVAGTGGASVISGSRGGGVGSPVSRVGGGSEEASVLTDLGMERAALEGANDGSMLAGVKDLFGAASDVADEEDEEAASGSGAGVASAAGVKEAVNDYDASERFSEDSLREARMANRLVQEGSDARLEELFGEEPEEEPLPDVRSWEEGAEEVAKMIGAEMVSMEVDVPEGMSIEEALSQNGPIMKVLWENPAGGEVEVPRGMNLGTMVEAGLISPVGVSGDDEAESATGGAAAAGAAGAAKQAPAGVFDPTAVRGAEERSAEVTELYAKVIANKAKARAEAEGLGGEGQAKVLNGDMGSEGGGAGKKANSWLGGIFGIGEGSGGAGPDGGVTVVHSGHEQEPGSDAIEVEKVVAADPTVEGKVKEMVGYDFILQDRDDTEGKVASSARAASRDAPEGEEAWASFEDIANEAMSSVSGMESVEYLPP